MVTTKDSWVKYSHDNRLKTIELKAKAKELQPAKDYVWQKIMEREAYVLSHTTLKLDRLKNQVDKLDLVSVRDPFLKTYCVMLIDINSRLLQINEELEAIQRRMLSWTEYKFIITKINKGIVDLLFQGLCIYIGKLGQLKIVNKQNNEKCKPRIDWSATRKARLQLLSTGKTPYAVTRDFRGVKIGDNGGEPYFVYHQQEYNTWFHWFKSSANLPNISLYAFLPSQGDGGIQKRLRKFLSKDGTNYLKFDFHYRNKFATI